MSTSSQALGRHVRERRTAKGLSLRNLAKRIGISPTYLSHVEQGKVESPPTARRVREMAVALGENPDEMIVLAGRVPEDLPEIIRENPTEIFELLREIGDLTPTQLRQLTERARCIKGRAPKS